jgi:hypothetical protein
LPQSGLPSVALVHPATVVEVGKIFTVSEMNFTDTWPQSSHAERRGRR